jgi:hypothetical protein
VFLGQALAARRCGNEMRSRLQTDKATKRLAAARMDFPNYAIFDIPAVLYSLARDAGSGPAREAKGKNECRRQRGLPFASHIPGM